MEHFIYDCTHLFLKSVLLFLITIALEKEALADQDPNLESHKISGECSPMSSDVPCVYCSKKHKFIALPVNSAEPKENKEANKKSQLGTR